MKRISFDDNFYNLSIIEKRNYVKKLIDKNSLKVIINSLVDSDLDILENLEIMNSLSKNNSFKNRYKVSNLKLVSLIIDSYIKNNKTMELNKYFNIIEKDKLKLILDYEIKNETEFSKMKICNNLVNSFNSKVKKKKVYIDDLSSKGKKILNKEIKNPKAKVSIVFILLIIVFVVLYTLLGYCYYIVHFYNNHVYPNIYLNDKLISGITYKELDTILNEFNDKINNSLVLKNSNDSYTYLYKDIGYYTNKDDISKNIKSSYFNLNGYQKLYKIFIKGKTEYKLNYEIDNNIYNNFLADLRSKVNVVKQNESFRLSGGTINYSKGINGFTLDESTLQNDISKSLEENVNEIELKGNVDVVNNQLGSINKKVSTFTTYYNEAQGRAKNIRNAVSKVNGKILYPGDVFSFYKAAGPYNGSRGYIFYAKDVGSGVCQVSTTIYNAALLLNLPIIARENHGDMVHYVDYGMDATVYGSYVDMKFKNSSNYPIYIEASASGGTLTISFWSNENIIAPGYSYKPRVEKISSLGFKTYLDTYLNGERINSKYLNSSYYVKGK